MSNFSYYYFFRSFDRIMNVSDGKRDFSVSILILALQSRILTKSGMSTDWHGIESVFRLDNHFALRLKNKRLQQQQQWRRHCLDRTVITDPSQCESIKCANMKIWLNQLVYCIRSHGTTCWMCLIVVLFLIFFSLRLLLLLLHFQCSNQLIENYLAFFFSKHANEHCYIVANAIVAVITTRDHFECFQFAWSYSWSLRTRLWAMYTFI